MTILGSVQALAVRPPGTSAPVPVEQVQALAGVGLQGDMHAHAYSPRQLLLASSQAYAALALPPHALRENLLLDIETSGLASGTVLQVGGEVTVRLMFQCEACGGLDAQRPGLSHAIGAHRGMLARVLCGGRIQSGDTIREFATALPAWPEDWRARVALVLAAVPEGSVIEYRDLARLAGIQSTYCRAFPRVIAALGPQYAGKAITAQSASTLPRWVGSGLFDLF